MTSRPLTKKRRSRRLRKKLRLAEFREDGFQICFRPRVKQAPEEAVDFLFALIDEVIEPRGLCFGGDEEGFIARAGRGSTSEADREAVRAWFARRTEVEEVEIGPLEDAWYGPAAMGI